MTCSEHPSALYEFSPLRRITGDALRPGGLEVTARALELCALSAPAVILDVGCGAGASLNFLQKRGFTVLGLDRSAKFVREAGAKGPAVRADALNLPLGDGRVDAVFCECVLSVVSAPERLLAECARVLRPGGWLALSDMTRRPDIRILGEAGACTSGDSCLQGAKTPAELQDLLGAAGFSLCHEENFSRTLRELAAKMIWEFGSMKAFWQLWAGGSAPCASSFGYTLLIARACASLERLL